MLRPSTLTLAAAVCCGLATPAAHAGFDITLDLTGVDASYQSYFTQAESFWESAITGYQGSITLTGLAISAATAPDDGVGGTLGSAGWTTAVPRSGFWFATEGAMNFDEADVANLVQSGLFGDVIRHEMAHVIGFGTLWTHNGVSTDGSGRFTGPAALAEYRSEFNQPSQLWVPVELGGGGGTANGHWDEVNGGGGDTGISDGAGRDMRYELMTGWLNGPTFVSRTTVASFADIGYTVNLSAVPEPGMLALWLLGMPLLAGVAVRRRQQA